MKKEILLTCLIFAGPSLLCARDLKHEDRQQKQIAEGIKSGELTPEEVVRLEKRKAELERQIKEDRNANGGKLTAEEHKQLEKERDDIGKKIHKDKTNNTKVVK